MPDSHKWTVLCNTTLGMLAATINGSILLISLPAVFRGIGLKALDPGNINYLLWAIIGYMIATAVLVVAFGRLGDQFGRAKMYNLGFAIFTVASMALSLLPGQGDFAAIYLIVGAHHPGHRRRADHGQFDGAAHRCVSGETSAASRSASMWWPPSAGSSSAC